MTTKRNTVSDLFSTTGHVFFHVARHPDSRVREIALQVNVTERTVMIALSQLVEAGLLKIERRGRRNTYTVRTDGEIQAGPFVVCVSDIMRLIDQQEEPVDVNP